MGAGTLARFRQRGSTLVRSQWGGGGNLARFDGGYPGQVQMGGTPARTRWEGVPQPVPDGGYPGQVPTMGGTQGGVPLPPGREGVPRRTVLFKSLFLQTF